MEWLYVLITMIPCLVMVVLPWRAGQQQRYGLLLVGCMLLFVWGLMSVAFVAVVQSFLMFVTGLCCIRLRARPRVALLLGVACFLVPFTFALSTAFEKVWHKNWVQQQIPVRSLAERLGYEKSQGTANASPADLPDALMAPFEDLEEQEFRTVVEQRVRLEYLHAMHKSVVEEFALAQDFGARRMKRLGLPYVPPLKSAPVPQPEVEYVPLATTPTKSIPTPSKIEQWLLHRNGVKDFLRGERMGYAESVNHTVGFEAHRFTDAFDTSQSIGEPAWKLARLELVSLLKHERPVVYVSEHLPNMDELRDVPTRPVTDFEARSLERLRRDENVVTGDVGDGLQMLGAIRASETCLKCHSVRRGELLGAFSYELVPVGGGAPGKVFGEAAF